MFKKEELLESSNYLLTKYQMEIYRQLTEYMRENNLKKKDVASKLGVSSAYVSQILNGDFNFTLKKLIELGVLIGKVPVLDFATPSEYLKIAETKHNQVFTIVQQNFFNNCSLISISKAQKVSITGKRAVAVSATVNPQIVSMSEIDVCNN